MKADYIDTLTAEDKDGKTIGTIEAYSSVKSKKPWFLLSEVLVFLGFKPTDHIYAGNTLHAPRHRYSLCKVELPINSDGSVDSVYAVDSKLARAIRSDLSRYCIPYGDDEKREAYNRKSEALDFLMDEAELFHKAHQIALKRNAK